MYVLTTPGFSHDAEVTAALSPEGRNYFERLYASRNTANAVAARIASITGQSVMVMLYDAWCAAQPEPSVDDHANVCCPDGSCLYCTTEV